MFFLSRNNAFTSLMFCFKGSICRLLRQQEQQQPTALLHVARKGQRLSAAKGDTCAKVRARRLALLSPVERISLKKLPT